jgi:Cu+-exporting ATPase
MNEQQNKKINTERMSLRIEGMHCAACVATIEKALLQQQGVAKASVNLLEKKATIDYEPTQVTRAELEHAVASTGYTPKRAKMTLTLSPPPRSDEWSYITKTIETIRGVLSVVEHSMSGRLVVEYDEEIVTLKMMRDTLNGIGFDVVAEMDTTIHGGWFLRLVSLFPLC